MSSQIAALSQQVVSNATYTQFITVSADATTPWATDIQKLQGKVSQYASSCPPLAADTPPPTNPDPSCSSLYSDLADQGGELQQEYDDNWYEQVQALVQDNSGGATKGIIHLYSLFLGQSKPFFRPADSTTMQNLYDYWDSILTAGANVRMEYFHVQNYQNPNSPAGIQTITGFIGDPGQPPNCTATTSNPTIIGAFQCNETANLQLMFPAVPESTVIDTRARLMWATGYPMIIPDGLGCPSQYNPPFNFPGYGWELTPSNGMSFAGFSGWKSPTLPAMQALINGWSGTPMSWLIDQSNAVTPDMPTSDGFFDVTACPEGANVWTTTTQGSGASITYAVVSMRNGGVTYVRTYPNAGLNWQMIQRPLAQGEQYYWYQ